MRACLMLLVMACTFPVHADEDVVARARARFEAGQALYKVQNYEDALHEFEIGNRMSPRPEFLINIALCHRGLKQPRLERQAYVQYLETAPADHPLRGQVVALLREIDEQIATLPPETAAPAIAPTPPPPSLIVPATTTTETTVAARPARHGIRKYWWIIPVTVVAAGGIAVGLGLGLSSHAVSCGDRGVGVCETAR